MFYGHPSFIIITTALTLNHVPNNFAYFNHLLPASPDNSFNIRSTKRSKWKEPKYSIHKHEWKQASAEVNISEANEFI
jgi:hypothetical protein